ncbi:hypothetical protein HHK36_025909 [Tetracentron sinense]|uniref:WRKY domain-containing protein n=1 Tax=Tetracentron sinense TaxID=13715 RepID=A0A834YLD8_TETSI|nr:hypothetical protein HHK36_025909 [Tetracentron sinense]
MAENESFKALKEDKKGTEATEKKGEEKLLPKLQNSLCSVDVPDRSSVGNEFRDQNPQSKTLALPLSVPSSENDHDSNCRYFSELLSGAMASPVANLPEVFSNGWDVKPTISTASVDPTGFHIVSPAGFKIAYPEFGKFMHQSVGSDLQGQFGLSHQEVLASVTAQAAEAQTQNQLQTGYASSSSELSPNSHTQSMSLAPSASPLQHRLSPVPQDNSVCMSEVSQQNSSAQKTKPDHVILKTPSTDEYNWRKYGQKQVKSTESSRSYYKCTNSECHAKKKIERSDHSGSVTEIIYKGQHNHCPPRKIRRTRARRLVSSAEPVIGIKSIDRPVRKINDSDPSLSKREPIQVTLPMPELKRKSSSGCDGNSGIRTDGNSASRTDGNSGIRTEEEHGDEPEPKRRMKESSVVCSVPPFKTVKEPKIVVQAAGDVGISGDGYRWRKSYYKCTSAGCPVRKHVERATADTSAIIITYEGKHDHDMPVPKKRHGQPSAALLIAAAAAMNNSQFKKTEALPKRKSSSQWSMDMEGELSGERALELGGEKVLESARTLLSIGIELKPY